MGESSEKHETKSDFSVAMFDYQRVKPTRTAISWGANNLGWFNDRGFHWFHSQFPHASNAYKSVQYFFMSHAYIISLYQKVDVFIYIILYLSQVMSTSIFCQVSQIYNDLELSIYLSIYDIWVWVNIRYPNNWMVNTSLD